MRLSPFGLIVLLIIALAVAARFAGMKTEQTSAGASTTPAQISFSR
jgi:hypothetical protein